MHPEAWNKRCDLANAPAPATPNPWDGTNMTSSPVGIWECTNGLGSDSTRFMSGGAHHGARGCKKMSGINEGTVHHLWCKVRCLLRLVLQGLFMAHPMGSWQAFSNFVFLGWAFHQQPKLPKVPEDTASKILAVLDFHCWKKAALFMSLNPSRRIGLPILKHDLVLWPPRRTLVELWITFLPNHLYWASPRSHFSGLMKDVTSPEIIAGGSLTANYL